ncbi:MULTISPECIES: hypothetical protein [unclassified Mesorhizobium]|uniref:hypothetical protein n=1 Tax=unclassified Mesorhizobium TaxID=325217 RepID=UPI002414ED0E|nr:MULTISPECIES: hypothetical protein [unclassified Mesorhizobium]MDG4854078.1 hypothetical protein [Mesorhizobium sp. WSM4982]MDG4910906.1 hypothetical protein [Mesorhizobium sp. WSM4983]
MAFKITYEPLNRIAGVQPQMVEKESAREAWIAVDALMKSDERVTISEDGHSITWQELRDRAKGSAN